MNIPMVEYSGFHISNGSLSMGNDGLVMKLTYPDNPKQIHGRLPENLSFGINAYKKLRVNGRAIIANEENPARPPSAGSAYLFEDGKMVACRRDMDAPTHKMYHSAYAGFPENFEAVGSSNGITQTALREIAEECLLVTQEKNPRLIVPKDSIDYTLASAKRVGLDLPIRYVDVDWHDTSDRLEVYDEQGRLLFSHKALLDIIFESETSVNALHLRRIPLLSEEVYPVDAEGIMRDGKFIHFNRESYLLDPANMSGMKFGEIMVNPTIFQTEIRDGKPVVYTPEYIQPFHGPDGVIVINPHVWAPDNQLVRYFDALGVGGYNWIEMELSKEIAKHEGRSLLPKSVLSAD